MCNGVAQIESFHEIRKCFIQSTKYFIQITMILEIKWVKVQWCCLNYIFSWNKQMLYENTKHFIGNTMLLEIKCGNTLRCCSIYIIPLIVLFHEISKCFVKNTKYLIKNTMLVEKQWGNMQFCCSNFKIPNILFEQHHYTT